LYEKDEAIRANTGLLLSFWKEKGLSLIFKTLKEFKRI
jgi:hypothetical protein